MIRSRRIIVLGIGNLIRADDGVGIHAIRALCSDGRVPEGVELLDGGTIGLQLLPAIQDATHLLAIDAVNTGASAGTLVRFDVSELDGLPGTPSVHQIGFADLIAALRLVGKFPQKMILFGIQPQETGWAATLSGPVEAALPNLVDAIIDQLQEWMPQQQLAEA